MMDNLSQWNKVCRPPEQALKRIAAGRLKGKSDINPQWRIKAMTETFGMCGVGWKFDITKQWLEDGMDGDQPVRCAFTNIELSVLHEGVWSEPIPGTGGSMLTAKEKYGPHTSDEAYKMATTDALSTAMKMLGVAADIYMGMFDGSKYTTPAPGQQQQPDQQPDPQRPDPQPARDKFKARAEAAVETHKKYIADNPKVKEYVNACMSDGCYEDLVNWFSQQ